jgi:hypothetical protein
MISGVIAGTYVSWSFYRSRCSVIGMLCRVNSRNSRGNIAGIGNGMIMSQEKDPDGRELLANMLKRSHSCSPNRRSSSCAA